MPGQKRAEMGSKIIQNTLLNLWILSQIFIIIILFQKKAFWLAELAMLNGEGDVGPTTETVKLQTCILNCQKIDKIVLEKCPFNAHCPMGNAHATKFLNGHCPPLPVPPFFLMGIARVRPCPKIVPVKHHYSTEFLTYIFFINWQDLKDNYNWLVMLLLVELSG